MVLVSEGVPHDPWKDAARRGARYAIRRKATTADDLQNTPHLEGHTVYEAEPIDTGLVDADENPIVRLMAPIGFIELRERE